MKRDIDTIGSTILGLFIIVGIIYMLSSCTKAMNGHACKWEHCPYKGITLAQYPSRAEGEEGSDLYYIDLLHLQHPALEYDELEDTLFASHQAR
jgi:hypothetical protein